MPQANLEAIVQRMQEAGESEEDIGAVIREMSKAPAWTPGADSLSSRMTRPPQTISDTPEKEPDTYWGGVGKSVKETLSNNFGPGLLRNVNSALQGPAHPESLSDMAGLLLPGVGVEGAVAREAPGLLRGVRSGAGKTVGGGARVAESIGRVSPETGAIIGSAGGPVGAAAGAKAPGVARAVGRGLRRGQRIIEGPTPKLVEPHSPNISGYKAGEILDEGAGGIPHPPQKPQPKAATFDDILGEEMNAEMAKPVVEPTGTTAPGPTITPGGRPSVTPTQYDEMVGKGGAAIEQPGLGTMTNNAEGSTVSGPGALERMQAMSDEDFLAATSRPAQGDGVRQQALEEALYAEIDKRGSHNMATSRKKVGELDKRAGPQPLPMDTRAKVIETVSAKPPADNLAALKKMPDGIYKHEYRRAMESAGMPTE